MKVVGTLNSFPERARKLKGLALEAHNLLETVTSDKPVLVVAPEGVNVAAAKRAFGAAAKHRGGSVDTRNGEGGTILVRWAPSGRQTRGASVKARIEHSQAQIETEMKRLHATAGNTAADFVKLSAEGLRKFSISAKRNLSRRAAS